MSENKKYYYLKLKENFFDQDHIKVIEAMNNGYIFSNILLKMYLRSLKFQGKLMITERIPYNLDKPEILAKVLNHDVSHLRECIKIAEELDIIKILTTGEIFMLDIQNFIGHSSTEGDRKKIYREKIKLLEQNGDESPKKVPTLSQKSPDNQPPERKREIKINKDKKIKIKKDKEEQINFNFKSYRDSYNYNFNKSIRDDINYLLEKDFKPTEKEFSIFQYIYNICLSHPRFMNIPSQRNLKNKTFYKKNLEFVQNIIKNISDIDSFLDWWLKNKVSKCDRGFNINFMAHENFIDEFSDKEAKKEFQESQTSSSNSNDKPKRRDNGKLMTNDDWTQRELDRFEKLVKNRIETFRKQMKQKEYKNFFGTYIRKGKIIKPFNKLDTEQIDMYIEDKLIIKKNDKYVINPNLESYIDNARKRVVQKAEKDNQRRK